ncbi:MAG TPA: ArsI/CadI family heavy metal resistance metalloenzyme [Pyrinomonadaceae bacterium]|nr:ArsI/CadI family heavy metal resistance metalloenzyme [Pyrinomonadaceae bacterium]
MAIKEINTLKAHLAINVKDVENSIEFYKKMFGIEPSKVRTGYAKFDVQNPPLNFTLNQVPFGERGALSHCGIQVTSTEDVLAMRENWHERGLLTRDEMQTNCCYAVQDKTWVNDPDGNEWEVFVVLEDNLQETSMCCVNDEEGKTACDTPAVAAIENKIETSCCGPVSAEQNTLQTDASCACETSAPAVGEPACCETQAVKFGITEFQSTESCCVPTPIGITR